MSQVIKVSEFCKNRKIKNIKINIGVNNKGSKTVDLPKGWNEYDLDQIQEYNFNKKKFNGYSHDTEVYNIIDVDDQQIFNKYFSSIDFSKTPQYKSCKKRLPHYIVKILNKPTNKGKIQVSQLLEDGSHGICDILYGGNWSWYNHDEILMNHRNKILEIEFEDIQKIIKKIKDDEPKKEEPKKKEKKVTPEKNKSTKLVKKDDDVDIDFDCDNIICEMLGTKKKKYVSRKQTLLIDMLTPNMSDNFEIWRDVGFLLNDIYDDKDEGFKKFVMFSRLSEKYDHKEIKKKYEKLKLDECNIRGKKIKEYLKDTNEGMSNIYDHIVSCLGFEDNDGYLADMIYEEYKDNYVCAYFEPKNTFYKYENGVWYEINGTVVIENLVEHYARVTLTKKISSLTYIIKLYNKKLEDLDKLEDHFNLHDEIIQYYTEEIEHYTKLKNFMAGRYKYCRGSTGQTNVFKKMRAKFYVEKFEEKLNKKIHLISFGRYVYDLKKYKWREARKDDYISVKCGITKEELDEYEEKINKKKQENKDYVEPVQKFLRSTFPTSEQYEFMLNILSDCLYGKQSQRFNVWSGTGGNAKSKLQEIMQIAFGGYYSTVGVSFITTNKDDFKAANPELYKARYARCLFFNEPSDGEALNNSIMKKLASNDSMNVRDLYKTSIEIKPQFSIFILCNTTFRLKNINDDSIPRRLLFNKFTQSFKAVPNPNEPNERHADPKLSKEKYMKKISLGLMILLIKQWKIVDENYEDRKYPETPMSMCHKREFIQFGDEFPDFFKQYFTITYNKKDFCELSEIMKEYLNFCGTYNYKPKENKEIVSKIIKAMGPGNHYKLQTNRTQNKITKTYYNIFVGLKLGKVELNEEVEETMIIEDDKESDEEVEKKEEIVKTQKKTHKKKIEEKLLLCFDSDTDDDCY